MNSTYLVDDFAILERLTDNLVKIRLFPFGRVIKNGVERIITPELAAKFRLPHFKPPVKLGSHAEATPAGGQIVGLEVGADGLYGLMTTTELGGQALMERHYGYHSPEVIWEDGYLEHPETGAPIPGPLIVGDALLHTPHLGEATALYSIDPIYDGGVQMTDTVTVPLSWFDRLLGRREEPEPAQEQAPQPQAPKEDYAAKYQASAEQVMELEAKIAQMQATQNRAGRISHFAAELPAEAGDIHEMLADLEPEVAEAVATRFKALYAQIEQQPDKDVGRPGQPDELGIDPVKALNEAVMQYAQEHQVSYPDAFHTVTSTNPDLLDEYLRGVK